MQADTTARHSSYVNLTPYECAIKYKNRNLLVPCGCATIAVILFVIACWPYVLGEVGRTRLFVAIPIALPVLIVEFLLISHLTADFQGIVTQDCDPAKMLKVEDHILDRVKRRRHKAQHLLIASQAAVITGDVARSRQLLDAAKATGKLSRAWEPMAYSISMNCATIEKDMAQLRILRDELATYLPKSRGAQRQSIELALLFADESIAAAEGDLQTYETLHDKAAGLAKYPQQRASIAFRRAQLESLKGDDEAARPYYEQAKNEGGTCYFAYQAAEWLAAH